MPGFDRGRLMLLAIDTCGALGGVALGWAGVPEKPTSQDRDVGHPSLSDLGNSAVWFRELAGKSYSERLIAAISELLGEAAVALAQIAAVVVVHGPGSFTGIRIGVSAAKGLAEAWGIPLIAVSRLELLARQAGGSGAIAVLDAGRGEFFAGIYRRDAKGGWLCEAELLLTRNELAQFAADSDLPIVVCEEKVFESLAEAAPKMVAAPTAVEALDAGFERSRTARFDDVATLDANYLRRSETEMLARIAQHAAALVAAPGDRA